MTSLSNYKNIISRSRQVEVPHRLQSMDGLITIKAHTHFGILAKVVIISRIFQIIFCVSYKCILFIETFF